MATLRTANMSHSVTITRTTTTSTGSALFVNTGYLKTTPGLLKLAQLVLGAVCVGLVSYYVTKPYSDKNHIYTFIRSADLFFLLIAVTFMIGTFCLLTACLVSLSTSTIIAKTVYEVIYHGLAFLLYFAAGLTLIIVVHSKDRKYSSDYDPFLAASIIGLVVAALYLFSTVLANRSYRGI